VQRKLEIERPTYGEINHHIATAMSGITCPIRFRGLLNSNYRKMAVNLVPYPRLHFLTVSEAPLSARHSPSPVLTVPAIVESLFDPCNYMCQSDMQYDIRTLTGYGIFRGAASSYDVDQSIASHCGNHENTLTVWIPGAISSSICSVSSPNRPLSATLLLTHGIISGLFRRLGEQFTALFRRKAFVHHYTREGMDEMEFTEAESNANDLISEYGYGICDCCEEEEEEEEL